MKKKTRDMILRRIINVMKLDDNAARRWKLFAVADKLIGKCKEFKKKDIEKELLNISN